MARVRFGGQMRPLLRSGALRLLTTVLLLTLVPSAPVRPAIAAESIAMPFAGGKDVRIIQGYNGGTHQGRSRFGLDLVLADGSTSGAEAIAPADGTIAWAMAPGAGHGCVAIALSDGAHSVMLCHLKLSRSFARGEAVTRGQSLGTVGAPGTVGNNGVAHIHYELHNDTGASSPVPFSAPDGMLLEGIDLPASSTTAVTSRLAPIASSNRAGSSPSSTTATARSDERTQLMASTTSEPATLAAASLPGSVKRVEPSVSTTAAAGVRIAVVQGTDSCLNVHKQPAVGAAVVGCAKEGTELALKPLASGADAGWRQTDQGWVSSEYLKRTRSVVAGTGDCLNVRESPKAGAKPITCLRDGTAVTLLEGPTTADGFAWYRVARSESPDQAGWAVGKYLD